MVKNTSHIKNCNGLIVLVPYDTGQEFYSSHPDEVAYLPVYKDENLALMAVANQACKSIYVTFSSSSETKQEWEKRKYLGNPSR
ncbi:hypothetical protein LC612_30415 [Nostoc sp. CHAB 5834]|nr:hypothetical protein [Nostoc sp. CHAB 5834]